jgi:hypothetical protein
LFPKFPAEISSILFLPFRDGKNGRLPGHKSEKQGILLKMILVKAMDLHPEWRINPDEQAKPGPEEKAAKDLAAGGFRNSAYICILCLRKSRK